MTFAVCKIDYVVVDIHAVCRERKAEILIMLLFNAPRIGDDLLYHLKVHERFAAEEIYL